MLALGLLGATSGQAQTASQPAVKPGAAKAVAKPAASGAGSVAQSSAAQGKAIYLQNCAGCHGRAVEGGIAPSIRAAGQATLGQLKQSLLHGKGLDGRALRPTMPRFVGGFRPNLGKPPTDQELQSLKLFLGQAK